MSEPGIHEFNEKSLEPAAGISPFYKTDWKPAEYDQLRDARHKSMLKSKGYFVVKDFFSSAAIDRLLKLYGSLEHIGTNEIGMFVTAYSEDIAYRKTVHREIEKIVDLELNKIFTSFKPITYNFVIKQSNSNLPLKLHQDLALTDESASSTINIWMCMMDTDLDNGAVYVVPKTQYFIPPHRSRNNEVMIASLNSNLMKYAVPIPLKKRDLLVFDSRLLHGSLPNISAKDRAAAIGHICAENTQLTMVKPSLKAEGLYDIIEMEREDLFNANGYESENKSNFNGQLKSTIKLEGFEIDPDQLHSYFRSVDVPMGTFDFNGNVNNSTGTEQDGYSRLKSLFRRIGDWF